RGGVSYRTSPAAIGPSPHVPVHARAPPDPLRPLPTRRSSDLVFHKTLSLLLIDPLQTKPHQILFHPYKFRMDIVPHSHSSGNKIVLGIAVMFLLIMYFLNLQNKFPTHYNIAKILQA